MTDRELLELAAKAAGINAVHEFTYECDGTRSGPCIRGLWNRDRGGVWNPLTDDGDALRLAVKLRLMVHGIGTVILDGVHVQSAEHPAICMEVCEGNDDPYAATRRAIVRAAAEIGRTK